MIRKVTAMTVRQNLGELLNEVQYRGDSVVITKGGKPVAALVDIALFENIRRMREDFDRMCAQLAEIGKNMTESEVEVLVAEAVAEARSEVRAARARRRAESNQSGGK
jgi:prevent-host-death family protein